MVRCLEGRACDHGNEKIGPDGHCLRGSARIQATPRFLFEQAHEGRVGRVHKGGARQILRRACSVSEASAQSPAVRGYCYRG